MAIMMSQWDMITWLDTTTIYGCVTNISIIICCAESLYFSFYQLYSVLNTLNIVV